MHVAQNVQLGCEPDFETSRVQECDRGDQELPTVS